MGDGSGHEDWGDDADECDLEVGDPCEGGCAGGGEFAVGDISCWGRSEHGPEEDDDEDAKVSGACVVVL